MHRFVVVSLALVGCAAPHRTGRGSPRWDADAYRTAIDEGIEALLIADPVIATLEGDHRRDDLWPDMTKEGEARMDRDFARLATRLHALTAVSPPMLHAGEQSRAGTDRPALDARVLADWLDGHRAFMLAVRPSEKDPSAVLFKISTGLDRILAHPFAPLNVRMASIAGRLEKVPALLATVRARLDHPRRAGIEMTEPIAKGLSNLLHDPILHPDAHTLGDTAVAARVASAADAAARAVEEYQQDVTRTFPPDQATDQPIGADAWAQIARLQEGVTIPPHQLKQLAEAELARLQSELDKLVASAGTPGETREAFLARMAAEQPGPAVILDEYRASEQRVEAWLRTARFVTVPWDQLHLEITLPPPHNRAFSVASLNQSGVLDANTDARFEVNAPTPDMPPAMQQAMRAFHARGAMDLISAHEVVPGHYLQLLDLRAQVSKVRKMIWTFHFVEGWAHYCEQAILDAGFAGDPNPARARAYMLRLALQRAVRMIVDIGEADGSLSLDAAAARFEKDGLLAPAAARMEARRGSFWPVNMFAYTYGKLAIQKLRDAVRAREGANFTLQRFHDRLLSLGGVPVADVGELVFNIPRD